MASTDRSVTIEIQDSLGEPEIQGVFTSGHWTIAEVLAYLNQRQYQFLRDTGAVLKIASLTANPNTMRHNLPADWIATRQVAWTTKVTVKGNLALEGGGDILLEDGGKIQLE